MFWNLAFWSFRVPNLEKQCDKKMRACDIFWNICVCVCYFENVKIFTCMWHFLKYVCVCYFENVKIFACMWHFFEIFVCVFIILKMWKYLRVCDIFFAIFAYMWHFRKICICVTCCKICVYVTFLVKFVYKNVWYQKMSVFVILNWIYVYKHIMIYINVL